MNKNKITFEELCGVLDRHIDAEIDLNIVCYPPLKNMLKRYLFLEYGLKDEDEDLNCKEYFVELCFIDGEISLFIESTRGNSGRYKDCDALDSIDYFIFTDMTEAQVDRHLLGELGTWSWNVLVESENKLGKEETCNGDCENCCFDEEDIDENENEDFDFDIDGDDGTIEMIIDFTSDILDAKLCPSCTYEIVNEIWEEARRFGYEECRLDILDVLEE